MKLNLTSSDVDGIFLMLDFDGDRQISLPEFQQDFDHTVATDIAVLLAEAAPSKEQAQKRESNPNMYNEYLNEVGDMSAQDKQIAELTWRAKQAEQRARNSNDRLEALKAQMVHSTGERIQLQKQRDELFRENDEIKLKHSEVLEKITHLEQDSRTRMSKNRADELLEANMDLQNELNDTRVAMSSYKGLTETLADQAKGLKLMIERKKDEAENLIAAVRELSSQSFEQQKVGKLYYVVMLSRWQEAASNKKYTMVLTENKELRREVLNMEARETEQEQGRQNCEAALRRKTLLLEHVKQQMSSKTNQYLSIEKAEELQKIIAEI